VLETIEERLRHTDVKQMQCQLIEIMKDKMKLEQKNNKMMMYRLIYLIILFNYSTVLISQELFIDPSFEENSTWWSCKEYSTPDRQPGNWGVETSPSHGDQYVSLVTRGDGNLIPSYVSNTFESVIQVLEEKGLANEKYIVSFDASFSNDLRAILNSGDDILRFDKPIKLEIWLGMNNGDCNFQEYVAVTPVISHSDWKEYTFEFTSTIDFENILFQTKSSDDDKVHSGNVLIDNSSLRINPCDLAIPNAFTPDGDGINDVFKLLQSECSAIKEYSFSIFNRWGVKVYQTSDADEGWNGLFKGEPAPTDTYIYSINFSDYGIIRKFNGDVTLIR
jgi:gliding motility-associated-like protein